MVTIGLVVRPRYFVASLLFFTLAPCYSTPQTLVQQDQNNIATHSDTTNLSNAVDIAKSAFTALSNLNYFTAKELAISLPGISQEIVLNWGFGGSGDLFSPLPWTTISTRTRHVTTDLPSNFSFVELSKIIVQDELVKHSKQVSLLRWLTDHKLSPYKLFFIKAFLLVKDMHSSQNTQQLRSELLRLVIKLSITENIDLLDTTKPLSSHLPAVIKETLLAFSPEVIELIDSLWQALTEKTTVSTTTDFAQLPRTVYAYAFKDPAKANAFYTYFANYKGNTFEDDAYAYMASTGLASTEWNNFIKFNTSNAMTKQMQQLDQLAGKSAQFWTSLNPVTSLICPLSFKLTSPLTIIPQELTTALNTTSAIPAMVQVTTAQGDVWVAYITNHFGLVDTIKLMGRSFIRAFKEYINERNRYFKANPIKAQEYQKAWEEHEKRNRQIQMFLATEKGIESTNRLNDALKNIEGQAVATIENTPAAPTATIEQLDQSIADQKTQEQHIQSHLITWCSLQSAGFDINQEAIDALHKELKSLQAGIKKDEAERASLIGQDTTSSSPQSIENNLQKLLTCAQQLTQDGEQIPQELADHIASLIQQKREMTPAPQLSTVDHTAQREHVAHAYKAEAAAMQTLLTARINAIAALPYELDRNTAMVTFSVREKPGIQAYIQQLNEQAQRITEENNAIRELITLRTMVKNNPQACDQAHRDRLQALELAVGNIVDNREGSFVGRLLTSNTELQELYSNFNSDNEQYKKIKDTLKKELSSIMQSSDHLQTKAPLYRYLLQAFVPELLPFFDNMLATTKPTAMAFFGGQ